MRHASVNAAALGAIGLDDVHGLPFEKRPKALPPRQHLAGGDRHRRMAAQLDVAFQIVRRQRFLEPDDVVVGEHLRRFQRPLVAVRPKLLAAAGIDHQLDVRPDRVAGRLDQQLVGAAIAPAERTPAQLDRLEAARRPFAAASRAAAPARRTGSSHRA